MVLLCKGSRAAEEGNPKPQNASKTIRKNETYQKTSAGFSFPELAGYMPLRGDFETEHENDAELILMDIAFTEEDTQVEKGTKKDYIPTIFIVQNSNYVSWTFTIENLTSVSSERTSSKNETSLTKRWTSTMIMQFYF